MPKPRAERLRRILAEHDDTLTARAANLASVVESCTQLRAMMGRLVNENDPKLLDEIQAMAEGVRVVASALAAQDPAAALRQLTTRTLESVESCLTAVREEQG